MAKQRLKNLTAIDFGSFMVKLLHGSSEPTQIVLEKAAKIPLPEGIYDDGQIRSADQLKNTLKPVIQEYHLQGTPTICTLESSMTVIREMALPAVKPKEMREMIGYEIQNYLPIELNQYVIQAKQISEYMQENVKYATVMVAALPKEVTEAHLSLLEELGLRPMALDIHSNCQTKLLAGGLRAPHSEFMKDKTVALMDIGHRQANITILEKGNYRFNRLLSFGGANIDLSLSNFMGISEADARIMKTKLWNLSAEYQDTTDEARALNVTKTTVDGWLDEIERIFKFYTSRGAGNTIDAVLLMGGCAHIKGLNEYLHQNLGMPVEILAKLDGIQPPKNQGALDLPQYVNALGAMIRL